MLLFEKELEHDAELAQVKGIAAFECDSGDLQTRLPSLLSSSNSDMRGFNVKACLLSPLQAWSQQ